MGARVYIPGLGRFLGVDPVQGGTPNNYVYPADSVNENDISGQCPSCVEVLVAFLAAVAIAGASRDLQRNPSPGNFANMALTVGAFGSPSTSVRPLAGAAKTSYSSIRNGTNNYLRVGEYQGINRMSVGPAYSHYQNLNKLQKALSPIHIHLQKTKAGVDFNWFAKKTTQSRAKPRTLRLWGNWK